MRKGEKLLRYLSNQFPQVVLDRYEVALRDARLIKIIWNMTDEKFDEIIMNKTDMSKNELVCICCNSITYYYDDDLDQEEINNYTCSDCEESVKENIGFYNYPS